MKRRSVKINGVFNLIRQSCHILFPLLVFTYVSRNLGPDSYGVYSYAHSIQSYFLLAGTLGINLYAVREGARIRDDRDRLNQFISELSAINFITSIFSWIVMIALASWGNFNDQVRIALYILSIVVPSTFFGREWINSIFEDYVYIAIRYIIIQLLGVIAYFSLVHTSSDWWIYTTIYSATLIVGHIVNFFRTRRHCKFRLSFNSNLRHHIKPILVLFSGKIAASIYIQSDITMIGIFMASSDVGIYTTASKVYLLTKEMINALTSVAIPRISYYLGNGNKNGYHRITSKLFEYLFVLILPASVGLFLLSDSVIMLVGGSAYLSGSVALKILSIALPVAVFSGFYCNAIMIPNFQERYFMRLTIISAVVNISLNYILIPAIGINGAAITTLISEMAVLFLGIHYTKDLVHIGMKKSFVFSTCAGTMAVMACCLVAKLLIKRYLILLIVAIPVSVLIYAAILLLMKNNIAIEMKNNILQKLKVSK